jgi:hypothetical protein
VKRNPCISANPWVASTRKRLIYRSFSASDLQRAARRLQSRSKSSQSAGPVTVILPFTWIAGGAMLKAGYRKKGIDE